MRANEYIEINQSSIQYLDDIKRVIYDLRPLRKNKKGTDEYYNQILLSDCRQNIYKKDMQEFVLNKKNATNKSILEKFEGEIPASIAQEFRNQLFEVIKDDKSFGYMFYQLAVEKNQKNAFYKTEPIQCIPNEKNIFNAITLYRDDYPKDSLNDYLDDHFNYDQYCILVDNQIITEDSVALLNYFDTSYYLYDKIRCLKNKVLQVGEFCRNYDFNDKAIMFWTLSFVIKMIEEFNSKDNQLLRCKNEIHKIIKPFEQTAIAKQTVSQSEEENSKKNTFTTAQQVLYFHYLLDEIGINFGNSDKSQWVRFINSFTGKNAQDIKEKLNFNFEDKRTKRDLRIVADYVQELMPAIAIKIRKDIQE